LPEQFASPQPATEAVLPYGEEAGEEARKPMDYDWITQRIALGSAVESRYDAHELIVQGVTHVANLCKGHPDDPYFHDTAIVLGYFGLHDGDNEDGVGPAKIGGAIRFVDSALRAADHHKVYVHCAAGISRSAAVTVGYLMKNEGWTMGAALRHVRLIRPCVNPHPAHLMTLLEIFNRDPDFLPG